MFINNMVSIEYMEKLIKEAKRENAEYIGIENKRIYFGKDGDFGFFKWTSWD